MAEPVKKMDPHRMARFIQPEDGIEIVKRASDDDEDAAATEESESETTEEDDSENA